MRRGSCSSYNRPMLHDVETTPATTDAPFLGLSTGGLFLEALARRDFTAMACCLAPTVHFRALLPPRDVDVVGCEATMAEFRLWFANEAEAFEILDATIGEIGPRLYLRWRVRMTPLDPGAGRDPHRRAARLRDRRGAARVAQPALLRLPARLTRSRSSLTRTSSRAIGARRGTGCRRRRRPWRWRSPAPSATHVPRARPSWTRRGGDPRRCRGGGRGRRASG